MSVLPTRVFLSRRGRRGLWCVGAAPFLRRERTPSAQVERRRDRFTVRGREHALNANLNQRGATQVKTMFGKRDLAEQSVNLQKHHLRIVRPSRAYSLIKENTQE